MKVYTQMALAGTGLLIVAAIVTALILSDIYNDSYHDHIKRHSQGLHQVLAETLADRVVSGEALELRQILGDVISSNDGIAYIYVTDFDGKLFAHTFDAGFPRALLPTLAVHQTEVSEVNHHLAFVGIDHYSATLIEGMRAKIHIGTEDSYLSKTLSQLQQRVMGIALIVISIGLVIWLLIARRIAAPLGELTNFISRYGEGAEFHSTVLPERGAVEVVKLSSAMGLMVRQRKLMEKELSESERRLRTLMGNLPGMAYRCEYSPDWLMLFVSDGCLQLTGYKPSELVGNTPIVFNDLIHPSDRSIVWNAIEQAVSESKQFEVEYRIFRKDGTLRWLWEQGRSVKFESAEPEYLEGYITDITDKKVALQALAKNETLLRATFDQAAVGIARVTPEGRCLEVNQKLCETTGYSRESLLSRRLQDITFAEDSDSYLHLTREALAGERDNFALDMRYVHYSGDPVWIRLTASLVRSDQQEPLYLILIIEDIDARKKAEEKLREAAAVFRSTGEGVTITDAGGVILDVNDAFSRITGYSRKDVIGQNPRVLKSGRHDRAFYQDMWSQIDASGHWHGEIWNRKKDGTVYPQILTISSIESDSGVTEGYVGVFADISSLKATEARLDHLARHDSLTDLPNRLLIRDRLSHSLTSARRYGAKVGVIFFDVDRFKTINETLGHSTGDLLLVEIAQRIKKITRQDDTFGRISGDEFCLVLEGLHAISETTPIVQKISMRLNEPFILNDQSLRLSVSIGVAIYPDNSEDADALLSFADAAMYEAKEAGRNTYRYYTKAMTEQALEQGFVQTSLRDALEKSEFFLVYQPQIDLKTGQLVGLETLLRWNHPQRGLIPPVKFIPIAEQSGLIRDLGAWILETACSQARIWLDRGYQFGKLFVNVAGPQLHEADFPSLVRNCLSESGLPAEILGLEVTESFVMRAPENALQILNELRNMGIELAIDDFGTGYSSLSYLKRLPINKLKIDQSFIRGIPSDVNDLAITEAVIAMGRALDLQIIGEGVETKAQADFLVEKGCQQGQGYLYSKPIAPPELEAWIEASMSTELDCD